MGPLYLLFLIKVFQIHIFFAHYFYCLTCLEMGTMSTLKNGLKDSLLPQQIK